MEDFTHFLLGILVVVLLITLSMCTNNAIETIQKIEIIKQECNKPQ